MLFRSGVSNLKAALSDDVLELTWSIDPEENLTEPEGFRVYKARNPVEEADCENCPTVFELAADIPAESGLFLLKKIRTVYYETLGSGYIYRYKVMPYTDAGITGQVSDVVEVIVK